MSMVAQNFFAGRWPGKQADTSDIRSILRKQLQKNIKWGTTHVLGFPTMTPHALGLEAFQLFQNGHANAILTHTRGEAEKGFGGTHEIEKDLIVSVGDLLGDSNVDGYVAPGGTEANVMGIWIGREKLRKEIGDPSDRRVALLTSAASHYSLQKACCITDLGRGGFFATEKHRNPLSVNDELLLDHFIPASDGTGLHFVKCSQSGQIDVQALEATIRKLHDEKGIVRFIIFLNEGTTLMGAMDDTAAVGALVGRLEQEFQHTLGFYVHVDAAYGGFIYPFLNPAGTWAFKVPQVNSVTVDPYKMGRGPMAEGLFLCRKDLQLYVQQSAGYVNDGHDNTICGSRSGAYAAACWAVMHALAFTGYKRLHTASRKKAQKLYALLQAVPRITLLPQNLNMVSFILPADLTPDEYQALDQTVIRPFLVMWDWFDTDPADPTSVPFRVVKCNLTRDTKTAWFNQFVEALQGVLSREMQRV